MEKLTFLARDGEMLAYDDYQLGNDRPIVIFLHGSTYNARRYANLAKKLNGDNYGACLLNWRGHGGSQGRVGSVDYIGQLEDDLADFIHHLKTVTHQDLIIAGHSAGAIICLRYINKYGCNDIAGVSFIAPAINGPLETVRYPHASASWQYRLSYFRASKPVLPVPPNILQYAPSLNSLAFFGAKLLPFLRHRTILTFPASERMAKLEGRVLNYSYNLMLSCDINDYPAAFNKITVPTLLLCGANDEVVHPQLLSTIFNWHLPPSIVKEIIELENVNHIQVNNAAVKLVPLWLNRHFASSTEQTVSESETVAC